MNFNVRYSECEQELSIDQVTTLVRKVVSHYVGSSVIPLREKEDVIMAVLEKFFNNRKKIDEAFEGKSKITTYYTAIFNRMCCEVIRKEQKYWYIVNDCCAENGTVVGPTGVIDTEKNLAIKDELKRLSDVLKSFKEQEAKFTLFARYYFSLPVTSIDINRYSDQYSDEIDIIINGYPPGNKADVFNRLAKIVALAEGKKVKGDAVRMWLSKKLQAILCMINRNGVSNHTPESLQILMELQDSR